jgi:Ca2+-binding RTX toxin-like protein
MPITYPITTDMTATYTTYAPTTSVRPPIYTPPTAGYYIEGSEGNDSLYGSKYADEIHGRGGNDVIGGDAGDDRLFGEDGQDTLRGGAGNDRLDGGIGDDFLVGGAGADEFRGDAGFDTVSYAAAAIGVTVDMTTGGVTNEAQGDTYSRIERIIGSSYGDIVNGNYADNVLDGAIGDDWLFGQHGADTIIGGLGFDNLAGGADNDTFVIAANSGPDTISDFQPGSDRLSISGFGPMPFGFDGELASGYWSVGVTEIFGTPGLDAGDTLAYNLADHTLYQIQTDWDDDLGELYVSTATAVARFTNEVELHASDFLLA